MKTRLLAGVVAFAVGCVLVAETGHARPAQDKKAKAKDKAKAKEKETSPLGEKVVEFAKGKLGEQVGNGECWTLANEALKSAGGKSSPAYKDTPNKGDYVWGELVYGLEVKDGKPAEEGAVGKVLPGDIVQFRGSAFKGRRPGGGTYSMTASHHTAVVVGVSNDGKRVTILHQNWNGNKTVAEAPLNLADLQGGWIKIYRPQPR